MKRYLIALAALGSLATSCNKNDDKTGRLTVVPRHHNRPIDSCMIYIKYNAVDVPANGKYDDSAKCVSVNGLPTATFDRVPLGDHYVFGLGWDPNWTPPTHVRGGFAYPLQLEGTSNLDLAVSEF